MGYAEVCVNSPIAQRRAFSYSIPPGLKVEVGQAVWAPFGDKLLQGVVIELTEHPSVEETRDIAGVIDPRPLLSPERVQLARWISDYYLSPLFDAVALMLPPGFERRVITFLSACPDVELAALPEGQSKVFDFVREQGRVSLAEVGKVFGKRKAQAAVSQLMARGLLSRSYELEPVRIKPRRELYLSLVIKLEEAREAAGRLRERKAVRQAAFLDFLASRASPVSWLEVRQALGSDRAALNALVSKRLVRVEEVEVRREPVSGLFELSSPLALTVAQRLALERIRSGLERGGGVFLLHGVTGSGKTEVYLQALAEAVRLGKRAIALVPEIALTPQTIERFASRFPGRVAVLHSQLSLGEQFDEWRRIKDGEFDVVIGSRSAIFAPQPDLGLIIIDEEHEWTYKQSDSLRYHARSVALKLGELAGVVVVLGSATPDVESYYRARRGEYQLLELPERVTPSEGAPLPEVEVVDLRKELKAGNRSMFSRSLRTAMGDAIAAGGQVILFLNRRGAASIVQCRSCGFALRCRRCEAPLTYHLDEDSLICHQCNRREPVPYICPRCQSRRIKFLGIGTQKLEEEVRHAFPGARLLRWDSDVVRGRREVHEEILSRFRAHEADILIGTQMVAKGLDFPLVTVVGVVSADIGLNLPDFRAGERTFQLLTQVAGRAGRGVCGGRVIIQTYTPEHYAMQAAAKHDYVSFFEREIAFRRQLRNPPFSQLASLVYVHTSDERCRWEAERMKREIAAEADSKGLDISIIGPAPAFSHRLRGRFRWQLILRGSELPGFLSEVALPRGWTVDIDPVGLT